MGIYLGDTLLTGAGGAPIGSYATFHVDHADYASNGDVLETDDGGIWIKTGTVLTNDGTGTATDAASYPDAYSDINPTGTITADATNNGGGLHSGIISDYENGIFYLHQDNSSSTFRYIQFTPPSTLGTATQSFPSGNSEGNLIITVGGNQYIWDKDRYTRSSASTSRGFFPYDSGAYPDATYSGSVAFSPTSAVQRNMGGKPLCAYGFENHIIMSMYSGGVNFDSGYPPGLNDPEMVWTVVWDVTGVTPGTSQNLDEDQLVGVFNGYALKTSATNFWLVTGPDMDNIDNADPYKATEMNLDGTATGNISSFVSATATTTIPEVAANNSSVTAYPRIGTIDGSTWYLYDNTNDTYPIQNYIVAADSVGDGFAKFARGFSSDGTTDTIDLTRPVYVKIGNA